MMSEFDGRILSAEKTIARLEAELAEVASVVSGGQFAVPGTGGSSPSYGETEIVSMLWAELAAVRSQVAKLTFQNELLWARAKLQPVTQLQRKPPDFEQLRNAVAEGKLELALGTAVEIARREGDEAVSLALCGLAAGEAVSRPALALALAERAHEMFPSVSAARLIRRCANAGDNAARARAGRYVLANATEGLQPAWELDQLWRDEGSIKPLLEASATRRSGVAYSPPVYGRVLLSLHSSLPLNHSGYTYRSHSLLKALGQIDQDVVCYTRLGYPRDIKATAAMEPPSGFPPEDVVDGVRYRRLAGPADLGRWRLPLATYLANYGNALQLAIRNERANIVHTASNFVNAVAGRIATRDSRRPFIHEVRGFWELTSASRNESDTVDRHAASEASLEAQAAALADRVLTLNGPMRDELVQRGIDAQKIVVVPNGVDGKELSPMPRDQELARQLRLSDAPTIGYIGSFVGYEGLDDLVRALGLLRDRGLRFNALLVGSGDAFASLEKLVGELGLSDQVLMPGRVPHEEVRRYYSLIDIAPFPRKPVRVCELVSPMKPYEAMGMAKAVVVSSVAALSEMIMDGVTGRQFEKGSVGSLAQTLQQLINDSDLRHRIGQQGRKWVLEQRTWARSAATVAQVYKELAVEWAARRPA
jgi:glycosyltransferase involved in cell wall biosynthesis